MPIDTSIFSNLACLKESLLATAYNGISLQHEVGWFPPGHNGPWMDTDTPIRVTAHYSMVFFYAWKLTENEAFKAAGIRACQWIVDLHKINPRGGVPCRINSSKNNCNGLIGQAWAAEPLIQIGALHNNDEYLSVSKSILTNPSYDWALHGWRPIETNGQQLSYCRTLNQQIWFAAMRAKQAESQSVEDRELLDFLTHLHSHLKLNSEALPAHLIKARDKGRRVSIPHMTKFVLRLRNRLRNSSQSFNPSPDELERGYASFILYGLAMLEESGFLSKFAHPDLYAKIREAIVAVDHLLPSLTGSPGSFFWAYNPTGIEMAYVLQVFSARFSYNSAMPRLQPQNWLQLQFEHHLDPETKLLDRNTADSNILRARIYEAGRLLTLEE